jgi:hypothetical protein
MWRQETHAECSVGILFAAAIYGKRASLPNQQTVVLVVKILDWFMETSRICVEGKNCCSISRANRVAFLVDGEEPAGGNSIANLRNRLLAEHLGVSPEKVAQEYSAERSLVRAIEKLRGGKRTLGILDGSVSPALDDMIPEAAIIDPERPLTPMS